ncbi:MAG: bifunctional UDP-N-acetylglucosamine diphosphorylase/glucosamine-1-phosphate N-acetyltransferase GlmU [Pseudomonadota bacterium]
MSIALIVLAAGQGTRMKSDMPKVLHEIAGAPMLVHALRAGASLKPAHSVVVTGHGAERVEGAARIYDPQLDFVHQAEQKGTGHAAAQAAPCLGNFDGDAVVLYGDTPFVSARTLSRLIETRARYDVVVLGFDAADPGRYGRLIMNGDTLERIVEFKDADADTRAITFCNSGILAAPAPLLFDLINATGTQNAAGEYYLTDVVEIARERGHSVTAIACDEAETLGVNSRADLARAEAIFQDESRAAAMENGVTLVAPDTVHFSYDTEIGQDTRIEPNVVFGPGVTIEGGALIRAFSHLEGCHVASDAVVGPYARLRPGTDLAAGARVGNFVEVKSARIDAGAKINHLSYVGDAHVGARANIGAGTITCNYDGVFKHRTEIGEEAFIGSNTMLVAPVSVGREALTASGSVITRDVPDGALSVARAQQTNKPGLARKLFASLRARRNKTNDSQKNSEK